MNAFFFCCHHCIDEPEWHAKNRPNTHEDPCDFAGRGCDEGDRIAEFRS